ncbi:MAG: hypothetical protein ACQEVA_04895 [Myxococcota bacterium]
MVKKIAIIGPIALGALVYLFAVWNASTSLTWVERFSGESAAAMDAYGEWQWERPWARGEPRDCRSARILVENGEVEGSSADLASQRHALLSGEPVSGDVANRQSAGLAARAASECRYAGTEDAIALEGMSGFDWNAHLAVTTRVALDAAQSAPDVCVERASLIAELAHDASIGGALGALSYAQVELEMATRLLERCAPNASDTALASASKRLRRLEDTDVPFWRALHAESLLVELGARNAAFDIHRFPTDPLALKNAIFTGTVLRTWRRAIQARQGLPEVVDAEGPVAAGEFWESVFADPDDAYEHAVAPRPAQHVRSFAAARDALSEARRRVDIERAYDHTSH